MTGIDVRIAVRWSAEVGEGPVWDAALRVLWWVDILAGAVHRTRLDTGETTSLQLPTTTVGAVAPAAAGGAVVACTEGFGALSADDSFAVRCPVLPSGYRMNDAKCDAVGRFWAGATHFDVLSGQGALYRLDADWHTELLLDGLTLPNGLGWSPDSRVFYLADSMARTVEAFDFDLATGTLSGRRLLIAFTEAEGLPDGLCVDAAGCIWLAMWGGERVLRIAPDGQVLTSVPMPVRQPSSCAFAGPGLDVLYVTSARADLGLDEDALDGSIFAVTSTGATGTVQARFGAAAP